LGAGGFLLRDGCERESENGGEDNEQHCGRITFQEIPPCTTGDRFVELKGQAFLAPPILNRKLLIPPRSCQVITVSLDSAPLFAAGSRESRRTKIHNPIFFLLSRRSLMLAVRTFVLNC